MTTFGMTLPRKTTTAPVRTLHDGFCARPDAEPALWDQEIDNEATVHAVDRLTDAAVLCAECPVWMLCPQPGAALEQLIALTAEPAKQTRKAPAPTMQLTLPSVDSLEHAA